MSIEDIKPLDCIFFKGTEFVSHAIVELEKITLGVGEWSHVGLVVNREILPNLKVEDDDLYIWESTISSNCPLVTSDHTLDVESEEPVFGVQLRKLKDVVKNSINSSVKIGWGKLKHNPLYPFPYESEEVANKRIELIKTILDRVHRNNYHRPYQKNVCRLFAAVFTYFSCCRSSCCFGDDWMFCSQFVATVYESIGVISKYYDPELVLPQDLATPNYSGEQLPHILDRVVYIQ